MMNVPPSSLKIASVAGVVDMFTVPIASSVSPSMTYPWIPPNVSASIVSFAQELNRNPATTSTDSAPKILNFISTFDDNLLDKHGLACFGQLNKQDPFKPAYNVLYVVIDQTTYLLISF